ncbi:RagB/SusD family nutrient uptake outer membrane protein [Flammeovirga aprica]|uniref:RagB/SusD family nutrient uptake outer membrane protein n=1 Tax=Flammeovirga aprica JL-4 TaxID=694437 RepID=A0A7X9RWK8_9BACT|nr:RagB/SusD family nutrient uptake outer membrane protein [Flammeovirga aprica]NME70068.1 RagB/SusD family nutrient uptake outer membrane protein [Flammeovirga aprica JL-4]
MKNKLYKIILGGLLATSVLSCNSFLEEKNPNSLNSDDFGSTPEQLNSSLTAVYSTFKEKSLLNIVNESRRDDMCFPGTQQFPLINDQFYHKTFNSATSTIADKWSRLYKGIFRANQAIINYYKVYPEEEELDLLGEEVVLEEDDTHRAILAQARFFRGLFHFYAYNTFNEGKVVKFDFVPTAEQDFYQPPTDPAEMREFFRADFEFAKKNLPIEWESKDVGRVTAGAAAAVLGKSYLYEGDYITAGEYFKDVIENYGYDLTSDFLDNFREDTEFNSETILEINYSSNFNTEFNVNDDASTSNDIVRGFVTQNFGGWGTIQPAFWLTMAYRNDPLDPTDNRNYYIDEDGNSQLRPFSLRTSNSIVMIDNDIDDYYQNAPWSYGNKLFNQKQAYFKKYSRFETRTTELGDDNIARSGLNVTVIRLADVYLMYAETLIKGGADEAGVNEALKYINKVRYRSALELIGPSSTSEYAASQHNEKSYTARELMDHLMYIERPLELSVEGHSIRWMDLRRWGIIGDRFKELADRMYHVDKFVTPENKTVWASVLYNGDIGDDRVHLNRSEFETSVQNYVPSLHDYMPIPSVETAANPYFN